MSSTDNSSEINACLCERYNQWKSIWGEHFDAVIAERMRIYKCHGHKKINKYIIRHNTRTGKETIIYLNKKDSSLWHIAE
jgi:hypothetical protein